MRCLTVRHPGRRGRVPRLLHHRPGHVRTPRRRQDRRHLALQGHDLHGADGVLVIDDVCLFPLPDRRAASAFFEVVNARYEKHHPTIVTTNRGLTDWGEIFGDSVVAAAILDRLMHDR